MAASMPNPGALRKCGVVLTCFDNGRKRFRAIPVDAREADGPDDAPPSNLDAVTPVEALHPVHRGGHTTG